MATYLFNPINGVKEKITYSQLSLLTDMNPGTISRAKSSNRRLKSLNGLYVIDDTFTKKELDNLRYEYSDINEVWKAIDETTSTKVYQVSNIGRVRVVYTNKSTKILSQFKKHGHGKLHVKLPVGNKRYKEFLVHQLVAKYFVENTDNLDVVYHIDGNILNNDCNNLRWISREELGKITGGLSKSIPVIKIDAITGEELDYYESMAVAGRENFIHRETIRQCISGELKTAGGFVWKVDTNFIK